MHHGMQGSFRSFHRFLVPLVWLITPVLAHAQNQSPWDMQRSTVAASLRGLCVVSAETVWASGTGGTVIRTTDGGRSWSSVSVREATELDFRDIHAFDERNAVVLSAGQPARVYRTLDGGKNWTLRYEHPSQKSFFDSLSFWDLQHGIAMSDPVDGRILLIETVDGGTTWTELAIERRPLQQRGEAGFAASGTNMRVVGNKGVYIALGGGTEGQREETSRIVYSHDRAKTWSEVTVPMERSASRGIFSMAFADTKRGIVVGGDYKQPDLKAGNVASTNDGGKSWSQPSGSPPGGFRSGVAVRKREQGAVWIAVGTNGTDYSIDGGQNWKAVSTIGFHAVQFAPDNSTGYACGSDGRIAKWVGVSD